MSLSDPHDSHAPQRPKTGVVIVAGGSGSRLGAAAPKAFVDLAGQPILRRAINGVLEARGIVAVAVVVPASHQSLAQEWFAHDHRIRIVAGGAERTDSVAAGLALIPDSVDVVLVHDAARALTPSSLIEHVAFGAAEHGAAVPGMPVTDTIKVINDHNVITHTPPRANLRAMQTPQGFALALLRQAYAAAPGATTDDAALVEAIGHPVHVIPGHELAFKITTPADLARAEHLLRAT